MIAHQAEIAERRGQEQVGAGTLCDQKSVDVRAIANKVLGRGRIVIVVKRVDLGAMLDQKSGDFDRAGEMQRPLAVAAFGMDKSRIAGDQSRELLNHAE